MFKNLENFLNKIHLWKETLTKTIHVNNDGYCLSRDTLPSLFSGAKMKVNSSTAQELMQTYIAFVSVCGEVRERKEEESQTSLYVSPLLSFST